MFVILSILVLIAAMNIISGLIMLVKNKGRDIGILRTMGLTEGSVMRVFFICGASIGVLGTIFGVILGVPVHHLHRPDLRGGELRLGRRRVGPVDPRHLRAAGRAAAWDVFRAVALSLGLSFIVTLFPARRAARMNPVEALRYE
jgi:lipoprotein-releasing system permease protein